MIMVQPKLDTRLPAPLWPSKAVGSAESILALYQVTEGLGKSAALSVCRARGVPADPLYDPIKELDAHHSNRDFIHATSVYSDHARSQPLQAPQKTLSPAFVCVLSAAVNVALSVLKLLAGLATGSAALIADAYHSCSDLVSDGLALLASSTPQLERPCSFGIACMLLAAGGTMIRSSWMEFRSALMPTELQAVWSASALAVALVSIVTKEWLYRITLTVGRRTKSPSMVANAHHHRSDALSSIAAGVGIIGSILGCGLADVLAAGVVGGMVLKTGLDTAMEAVEAASA